MENSSTEVRKTTLIDSIQPAVLRSAYPSAGLSFLPVRKRGNQYGKLFFSD